MKLIKSVLIVTLLLSAISLAACGEPEPESLDDILAQAANVTMVKYDLFAPFHDELQTTRVWVKDNMMKTEGLLDGQPVETYLLDLEAKTVYYWHSPDNIPHSGIAPGEVADFASAMIWTDSIAGWNPTLIGSETTDGKDCYLVECVNIENSEMTVKGWIWKEHNFLVRMDIITAGNTGAFELKNISFDDIDDSVFRLPEVS